MLRLGQFLLKKDMNAALVAFGCVMLTFLGLPGEILAAVIVAFVTLQKDYKSGALVLAFVALPGVAFLLHKEISPFDFIFLQCVFVWIFAILLKKYNSWRLVFDVMAFLGVVIVAIFHFFVTDSALFWMNMMKQLLTEVSSNLDADVNIPQIMTSLRLLAPYFSGVLVFSTTALIFIELLLARLWVYRQSSRRGKLYQEFLTLRVGYIGAAFLTLVIIAVLLHWPIAQDVLFAVLLPFVVNGLSYLHYVAKRYKQMLFLIVLIYIGLFVSIVSIKIVILLSLIGYIDSWCDLRKRFAL